MDAVSCGRTSHLLGLPLFFLPGGQSLASQTRYVVCIIHMVLYLFIFNIVIAAAP